MNEADAFRAVKAARRELREAEERLHAILERKAAKAALDEADARIAAFVPEARQPRGEESSPPADEVGA